VLAPTYEAEKDGGEHVKIRKADRSAANFSVAVMFNVPGFSVIIDKEPAHGAVDDCQPRGCSARAAARPRGFAL
jgi:hypothetical protein